MALQIIVNSIYLCYYMSMSLIEFSERSAQQQFPPELAHKLREILDFGPEDLPFGSLSPIGREQSGFIHELNSITFIEECFGDSDYRKHLDVYPGLPLSAECEKDGIRLTIGIQPYDEEGKRTDGPSRDGLPYAVTILPYDSVDTLLAKLPLET